MKVNIGYLDDIVAYMLEAQYWDAPQIEDYLGFIERYQQVTESQGDNNSRENFRQELKKVLKAILNNPSLDYDEIFFQSAMHGLGSQEKAQQLFELIWNSFFGDEDWHDVSFSSEKVTIVDEPYMG